MIIDEIRLEIIKRKRICIIILIQLIQILYMIRRASLSITYTTTIDHYMAIEYFGWFGYIFRTARVSFIVFLLIGFWYTRENMKEGWFDIRAQIYKCRKKLGFPYTIMLYCLINTIVFTTVCISIAVYCGYRFSFISFYLIRIILLFYFLPQIIAFCIGNRIAFLKKKEIETLALIGTVYLFAGGFSSSVMKVSSKAGILYQIADLMCIFSHSMQKYPDCLYMYPSGYREWIRALFWILTCALFGRGQRKSKYIIMIVQAAFLFVFFLPNGVPYYDDHLNAFDGWGSDQKYYSDPQNVNAVYEESINSFNVKKYDMKLEIKRLLKVDAILYLKENDCNEYDFTLYHGYKIIKIYDLDDNELAYERDGDYISIYSENELNAIKISYVGMSKVFYSDYQGVFLPAYFAYYPIPGKRNLFNNDNYYEYPKENGYDSEYCLHILSDQNAICNGELCESRIEEQYYYCKAKGVTIIADDKLRIYYNKDYNFSIVYSNLEYSEEMINAIIEKADVNQMIALNGRTIITSPYLGINSQYEDDKYIIIFGWKIPKILTEEIQ